MSMKKSNKKSYKMITIIYDDRKVLRSIRNVMLKIYEIGEDRTGGNALR